MEQQVHIGYGGSGYYLMTCEIAMVASSTVTQKL